MADGPEIFRFDDVTVDSRNFHVSKGGEEITLTPKAFDVLAVLLRNSGRVVEKQEIFDTVWKDTFVTDNALVKIVRELRQALGDEADSPHLIETVPKRGYRFIGEPEAVSENESAGINGRSAATPVGVPAETLGSQADSPVLWPAAAGLAVLAFVALGWLLYSGTFTSTGRTVRTIAVLPFQPLSADSRDESLEMGIAETLINRLSGLEQLTVRPFTSVRKYTDPAVDPVQAGRDVQVEAVLEGGIQKAGDRVRITVRLVDVASGKTLWSDKFDESFSDIFKVQDSISERVTNALLIRLSSSDRDRMARWPTDDPAAYKKFLECQLLFHGRRQDWVKQSLQCYEDVITMDAKFAPAYVGAADAYVLASGQSRMPHREAVENAKRNITKALELDDTMAEAHNVLAEIAYQYDYDWGRADTEFKKAIELNPNVAWIHQAYGWFLMCQGRLDEAAAEMDKAKSMDLSSVTIDVGRGRLYYFSRDFEKARLHFEKLIALEPNDSSLRFSLFTILEQQGKYDEAAQQMLAQIASGGATPAVVQSLRDALTTGGWQGFWQKQLDLIKEREAHGIPPNPLWCSMVYTRIGPKEQAFYWLGKRIDAADPGMLQLKIDPAYDVLRDDPRYAELLARIGLTP